MLNSLHSVSFGGTLNKSTEYFGSSSPLWIQGLAVRTGLVARMNSAPHWTDPLVSFDGRDRS